MPKEQKVHVTFKEKPSLVKELKKACIDQGVTVTEVLHAAILAYLDLEEDVLGNFFPKGGE